MKGKRRQIGGMHLGVVPDQKMIQWEQHLSQEPISCVNLALVGPMLTWH